MKCPRFILSCFRRRGAICLALGAIVGASLFCGVESARKLRMIDSGPENGVCIDVCPPAWPMGSIFGTGTAGCAVFGSVQGIYLGEVHSPIRDKSAQVEIVRQALRFGAREVINLDLGDNDVVAALIENGRHIEYVFATCSYRGDECVRDISLLVDALSSLRGLNLLGYGVTDETVEALCRTGCDLKSLALGGGELSERAIALIAERWPGIREVRVSIVSLSASGLNEMVQLRELQSMEILVSDCGSLSDEIISRQLEGLKCQDILIMTFQGNILFRRKPLVSNLAANTN